MENSINAAVEKLETFSDQLSSLREEFKEKLANDAGRDKIIKDLNEELRQVRKSEKEKSDELMQFKNQKDFCESLMLLIQEIQMQLDEVREDFHGRGNEEKSSAKEAGESDETSTVEITRLAEKSGEISLKIDDVRRKVDSVQEAVAILGADEKPAYQISSLFDTTSLIDLKMDRILQQQEFFDQEFQDYRKCESEEMSARLSATTHMDEVSESMMQKLNAVSEQMNCLQSEFKTKLKTDAQKDKIIDNLHKELQEYKSDIQKKLLQSMIMDIIQIMDNIRKLTSHYASVDPSENDPEKILKILESIPSDLEDIFLWQGIKPFSCNSDTFDPSRQRVLKKLETHDLSKDKTVAESVRPGYEWDDKVIRPEMVAAYIYKKPPEEPVEETSPEPEAPEVPEDKKEEVEKEAVSEQTIPDERGDEPAETETAAEQETPENDNISEENETPKEEPAEDKEY